MASIFKSLESFTPDYVTADGSLIAATEMYQAMDAAEAAAESLSAILDDYATVYDAMKTARTNDRCAAFEALMTPQLKAYASMEEAKDTRTFWTKVKEFFIRLWHSVEDFFAKFSVFANAMKNKLEKLNIKEIAKGVDKDLNVESIKVKKLDDDKWNSAWAAITKSVTVDDQAKLSETAKTLAGTRKAFTDAMKDASEATLDLNAAEEYRKKLIIYLNLVIRFRQDCVNRFKSAVNAVKGGMVDGDPNKKLRINALKDARHGELMALLTVSKQLIKDAKAFIKAVKGMKKKKAA
jgi:hypothetical protein